MSVISPTLVLSTTGRLVDLALAGAPNTSELQRSPEQVDMSWMML